MAVRLNWGLIFSKVGTKIYMKDRRKFHLHFPCTMILLKKLRKLSKMRQRALQDLTA